MQNKIIISNYDDIKNPYYGGGGAIAIHEIAKRLVNKYDVTVVTGKYKNSKNEKVDGVYYKRIGVESVGPKMGQLLYYFSLFRYFKNSNFDLWIENFTPPFSTNFLPTLTDKPVIGLVHMLIGEDMKRKYKLPFDIFENFGIKRYKNFIVTTDNVKREILKIQPKANVVTIPNGVNLGSKVNEKNAKKHILYLGRIEVNQKGLDLLLESYKLIENEIKYDLIIAGNGSENEINKLNNLIKKLNLSKKVKLVGRIDGKVKDELISQSIFIVIPSRFETFSITALESLTNKVPVICFDINGLNWISNKIVVKVKPFNTKLYSKGMLYLSNNRRLRKELTLSGKKFTRGYSWENRYKDYEKFINTIQINI